MCVGDTSIDRILDNSHCVSIALVNDHQYATDFRHLSVISQTLPIVKIRAKLMQREPSIKDLLGLLGMC